MSDRHILIADPDPVQRQLIDLLLTDERNEIVAVDTARAVLEYLRSTTPALIVIANELPDLSGIAVSKRVKSVQRLSRVPIIVTTAEPSGFGIDPALRHSADEAGVDLLLPKPLGDKALKERSRRLLAAAETDAGGDGRRRATGHHTTAVIERALKELDDAASEPDQATATAPGAAAAGADGQADEAGRDDAGTAAAGARPTTEGVELAEALEELMALRDENALLKRRAAALQHALDKLKAESESRRGGKNRGGLFGRRK